MMSIIGHYETADLVFIRTITNLHPGVGKTGEIVDLPVQRDQFDFPMVYASSLKGAIKSYLWQINESLANILLGKDESPDFASPISITDAFLLAFPARSLKGVYCYLTSPLLLKRFKEYLSLINPNLEIIKVIDGIISKLNEITVKNRNIGLCDSSKNLVILDNNKAVINETLILTLMEDNDVSKLKNEFNLDKELVVAPDDICKDQVVKSLIRLTRVKLKRELKTVDAGPWTEEYIPSKTLLFTVAFYSKMTNKLKKELELLLKEKELSNLDNLGTIFRDKLHDKYLIIGGNETIGSGIINITFKYTHSSTSLSTHTQTI